MAAPSIARSNCFRAASQFNRVFAAPAPSKAFFTTSTAPLKQIRPSITSYIPAGRIAAQCRPQTIRNASTTSKPAASATPAPEILTWNRFFDLRRKRRFINLGASVVTAVITVGVAAPIIANQDIDTWGAQISGMDPFVVLGVTTFTVAIAGWMCGPTFGTAGFKLWAGRRGWNKAIAEKEKSFYARIKRYRADPSSSSPQNPIPDYYGEKIASVKDYRRWLKDQRVFNRKKNRAFVN
ncbi:hypothetical protein Q7P35_011508 [Cladosporium inversicolor]